MCSTLWIHCIIYKYCVFTNKYNIVDQLEVVKLFSRLLFEEESLMVGILSFLKAIDDVLKSLAKDKSPGLDDWIVEFFLLFFLFFSGRKSLSLIFY